ncbi:hypothetical protein M440DRAFT_1021072 [Trichoderma longibrachiatum ATCC 18648]|uniref:Uncharacterized protein n=1 Tax=Trichoderma longibrachiatum ATCC 18648 TaxID=983965 RepID=A0A2T4CJC1_TRILO|nr:hypothetical protein M440DRAFT_1021072 [Trichoderma longibrachiatum ATCC 18648]
MSGLHDILSPLTLAWGNLGIEHPVDLAARAGKLEGLWDDDYDPYTDFVGASGDTMGISTLFFMAKYPSETLSAMEAFYKDKGVKIWQLRSLLIKDAAREIEWSSHFGAAEAQLLRFLLT